MAYGFQQLDASENVLVDSSKGTSLIHHLIVEYEVTLYPNSGGSWTRPSNYPNNVDLSVMGCTSQADFGANYIAVRNHGNGTDDWGWPSSSRDNTFGWQSYSSTTNIGRVRMYWGGVNLNWSGSNAAQLAKETQIWNIYSIGKNITA